MCDALSLILSCPFLSLLLSPAPHLSVLIPFASITLLLFDPPPIPFSISLELFPFNNDIDSHFCSISMNYITTCFSSELGKSKKLEIKQIWLQKLHNLCQTFPCPMLDQIAISMCISLAAHG